MTLTSHLIESCPVCKCDDHSHYITTQSMMSNQQGGQYHFRRCTKCHSVFLHDPVQQADISTYYPSTYLPYRGPTAWGKYAGFVAKSLQKVDRRRVKLLQSLRSTTRSDLNILDVGCGKPTFLKMVKEKSDFNCTGIDFTDQGWAGKEFGEIKLINSALEDYESAQKFDVITLWHYLEHDYNLQTTEKKLFELVKPGGYLVIEVPDYQSISQVLQKRFWQGWHTPRHLTLFSAKGFRLLFTSDKWIIKQHQRNGTLDAFTLFWLGRMEKKGIDWETSMEKEFWPLVWLKVWTFPLFLFEKLLPLGIQTLVIQKKEPQSGI